MPKSGLESGQLTEFDVIPEVLKTFLVDKEDGPTKYSVTLTFSILMLFVLICLVCSLR